MMKCEMNTGTRFVGECQQEQWKIDAEPDEVNDNEVDVILNLDLMDEASKTVKKWRRRKMRFHRACLPAFSSIKEVGETKRC